MNNFCKVCKHKNIPSFLKENFNKLGQNTFIECPIDDERIAGCLIANLAIDWKKFVQYLYENEALTVKQIEMLKGKGWDLKDNG